MSIFSTLNTGVSGLGAAQIQISTTGHNITNANSEHYTRQRAVQEAHEALHMPNGDIGLGTKIKTIVRIHDELVFSKMRAQSTKLEENEYLKAKLEEASQRFADLSDAGILQDMQAYQKAWNDYASNPADGAMKINLIQTATNLANSIKSTRDDLFRMQTTTNQDIVLAIDEINRIAKDISELNKQIDNVESVEHVHANDLRDQRDFLELKLAKLVDSKVFKDNMSQDFSFDSATKESSLEYHLNVNGFSLVDNQTFHPLKLSSVTAGSPMQKIYYELQDGTTAELSSKLTGGVIGAALKLRGREFNTEKDGFNDGILQDYIDMMDALASSLIINTNNLYAKAAQPKIISKEIHALRPHDTIMAADKRIKAGHFDLVVYDNLGNEVARKSIEIDSSTAMYSDGNSSSLIEKINSNTDENDNHNSFDDFDDFFRAGYSYDETKKTGVIDITPLKDGYRVGIEDNGTNIAGVFGLGEFFSGKDARDINVASELRHDPMRTRASSSGADGNNDIANAMGQLYYDDVEFFHPDGTVDKQSFSNYYRTLTTKMASIAQNNETLRKTNAAIYENMQAEYQSISGVNINEELSNLMKFQASFGASAKIISTIDKMLDTLLGIKQ